MILEALLLATFWAWDPVPGAASYCFYWDDAPPGEEPRWNTAQRMCTTETQLHHALVDGIAPPLPPGVGRFYVVTAWDANGNEGSTGHGPVRWGGRKRPNPPVTPGEPE